MIYLNNATLDEVSLLRNEAKSRDLSSSVLYSSSLFYFPIDKLNGSLLVDALSIWIDRVKNDENTIVPDHENHSINVAEALLSTLIDDLSTLNSKQMAPVSYKSLLYNNIWQMEILDKYAAEESDEINNLIINACIKNNIEYREINAIQYHLDECSFSEMENALLEYTFSPVQGDRVVDAVELLTLLRRSAADYQSDYQYESILLLLSQLRNGNITTTQFISLALPAIERLDSARWGKRSIDTIHHIASSINKKNAKKSIREIESIIY